MTARPSSTLFALFRVAAGPRVGHGHLRRAEALADALGRSSRVSIRGGGADTRLSRAREGSPTEVLAAERPAVLVIDEPNAPQGRRWCHAAMRLGIPSASLHDLGLARLPSMLAIDGSISSPRRGWPAPRVLRGPDYAVIAPPRTVRRGRQVRRVLVSLGGSQQQTRVAAIVAVLRQQWPEVEIVIPSRGPLRAAPWTGVSTILAPAGLAPAFAEVDAAIVGGGMTLYESVAAGVPTVAVAVVAAQVPTIRGFAAQRLVLEAGTTTDLARLRRRIVRTFTVLQADSAWRRRVGVDGPRTVDGQGAQRVARAIAALAETPPRA